jgi:hypothetical protein
LESQAVIEMSLILPDDAELFSKMSKPTGDSVEERERPYSSPPCGGR